MVDDICSDASLHMDKTLETLKLQLTTIRTGRANAGVLDGVKVDYYGSPTPLNQVAGISVGDARLLVVKPWEKSILRDVERAILEANLGFTPLNDGEMIRIPVPALTEERRREFVKQAKQRGEEAKIAVRSIRRDANEMLKAATKESEISEDDEKRGLRKVQELTDLHIARVEEILVHKENEIMEV